jgi:signal transduction histidine kinase
MHANLYLDEPAPDADPDLVHKGFLGIRATALTRNRVGPPGVNLESVAPIETREGVQRVVGVTFPLTPGYLREVSRRTGSGITLILPQQSLSTLPDPDVAALLSRAEEFGTGEDPFTFDAILSSGPTRTRVGTFRIGTRKEGLLLLTIPMNDLLSAKRGIFLKGVLVTAIVLGAASLFYMSLIRRVTRPLEQLSRATHDIAEGNLDLRVMATTDDEVGDLAASFNRMVQRLRESRHEIEEWNRTLEGHVEERTQSLQEAHTALEDVNAQLVGAMAELRETQDQMVQAEKMAAVGQMASTMAHEIKNPLAGIRAALEVIAPELEGGAYAEVPRQILQQVDRLASTTTQLLGFARPSAPERVPVSLRELIETVHFLVGQQARRQNVVIRMDLDPEDRRVLLDPQLTSQAFLNIALNALQAMEDGGTLVIALRWPAGGGVGEVSFTDTGSGMTAEVRGKIFTPFFTTKRKGTGLGLYAVQEIVGRQGGAVNVASAPGEGTTVSVRLPAVEPAAEDRRGASG